MDVPGDVGCYVIGDKAVEFYLDLPSFVRRSINTHNSRVFMQQFLLKPTVFIASNAAVCDLLKGSVNRKIFCIVCLYIICRPTGPQSILQGLFGFRYFAVFRTACPQG